MKKSKRPAANPLAWLHAITGATKLKPEDVVRQTKIVSDAIDDLLSGGEGASTAWGSLALTINMCIAFSRAGIGRGRDADIVICQASEGLAYTHQEHAERGTWALRAEDRIELRLRFELLRDLHKLQLESCSFTEFERAWTAVQNQHTQAMAGNASPKLQVIKERPWLT